MSDLLRDTGMIKIKELLPQLTDNQLALFHRCYKGDLEKQSLSKVNSLLELIGRTLEKNDG